MSDWKPSWPPQEYLQQYWEDNHQLRQLIAGLILNERWDDVTNDDKCAWTKRQICRVMRAHNKRVLASEGK